MLLGHPGNLPPFRYPLRLREWRPPLLKLYLQIDIGLRPLSVALVVRLRFVALCPVLPPISLESGEVLV